jgi:flagellar hook-associated protein 1 FlgK
MAGLFSAIDTLSSALDAFQTELSVTGNNVSNVNTPGYTREQADLAQAPTITQTAGHAISVGNGVTVGSVNRIQNMFLQQQSQTASADSGQLSSMSNGLAAIQSVLNEPGTSGVSNALSSFFNAYSGLASNPSDPSQQLAVQTAAMTLTQRVQTLSQNLSSQAAQNGQSITTTVQSIQTAINNIANDNQQIHLASTSTSMPNSLLDKRDQDINTLSSLVGVQSQINPDGTANVSMNGMTLVDQSGAIQFPSTYSAANSTVTSANGTTFPVTSGQLAGQFSLSNTITGYQSQLDTLANTVTSQVNALYATATDSAGNTNMQFFAASAPPAAPLGAAGFALAPAIAANSSAIATGTSGNASDGGVALAISQLQNSNVAGLGNQTIEGFYTNFVGAIGTQVSYYNTQVSTQTSVTAQIASQVQSVSGVSLDDEMSSMLEYQRSYQASAQALSSINTAMDSLMSMLTG